MIVAIDYGERKCGVAFGKILPQDSVVVPTRELKKFVERLNPDKIVFGMPLSMSGRYSQQTFKTVEVALSFSKKYETYLCDERLTTRIASKVSKRDDAVSAALIFQSFVENPAGCTKIEDRRKKVNLSLESVSDRKVLLYEFPDPSLKLDLKEIDVVTKDPVLAYFFYKKGFFVERNVPEKKYDLIISGKECEQLKKYLSERGELVCL
ncbi:Holliday junction resolvase [Thermotoga sp. RQ7]|uniref:RuvX/YqgF family protein n=1 Tax=Thermotoga sp. RQ7 TaxID=126738 RepID=UPI0005A3175A|nr:RuvX/YqgF family protein [Thermotoga sp. RQ7]AJG41219.1 Holliday junction resolvase [Thermotoga sp. RQ7]MDK2950227.1 putative pre6S rRNA nuclease [Thermotoga sp.]